MDHGQVYGGSAQGTFNPEALQRGLAQATLMPETSVNILASDIHEQLNLLESSLDNALTKLTGQSVGYAPQMGGKEPDLPTAMTVLQSALSRLRRLNEVGNHLNRAI